jgi:hypothetical protein
MASFDREREVPRRRRPSRTRGEGSRAARGKESHGIVGSGRCGPTFLILPSQNDKLLERVHFFTWHIF